MSELFLNCYVCFSSYVIADYQPLIYLIHSYCHRLHYNTELQIIASNCITNTIQILQEDLHQNGEVLQFNMIRYYVLCLRRMQRGAISLYGQVSVCTSSILKCTIFDVHHVPQGTFVQVHNTICCLLNACLLYIMRNTKCVSSRLQFFFMKNVDDKFYEMENGNAIPSIDRF